MKTIHRFYLAIFIAVTYCSPAIAQGNFSQDLAKGWFPLLWMLGLFAWFVSDFSRNLIAMLRMSWWVGVPTFLISLICVCVLWSLPGRFYLKLAFSTVICVALLVGAVWFLVRLLQLARRWLWNKFSSNAENGSPVATTITSAAKNGCVTAYCEYDPRDYFVKGKFFLGMSESGPKYYEDGDLPHMALCGSTGVGKGVAIQTIAPQALANGEALFLMDPKGDEYLASVILAACELYDKKYHFLNLAAGQPHQINLIEGADRYQIEELFKAAAGLNETGKPSDFYLFADRYAAQKIAEFCEEQQSTLAECYAAIGSSIEEDAPKMHGILRELARAKCINATSSQMSIARVIENGEAMYIAGSLRDDSIKRIQRMLFVRILQIVEVRDRTHELPRRVCVVLDEFKHHLARVSIEALGTSRDKGLHCVLAYQSVGDLADVSADLSVEAVKDAVLQNCRLQFVYKVIGADTAEWCAANSGTKEVSQESITYSFGQVSMVEQRASRTVRTAQAPFVEANEFLSLPKGQAVLFGSGIPVRVQMSPFPVAKSAQATMVVPAENSSAGDQPEEVL